MRDLPVGMLIAVLIAVPEGRPQRAVANAGSIRIAERSVSSGAIRRAAQLAAQKNFDDQRIIDDSRELDLVFQIGEPLTTCRVKTHLVNGAYQGIFVTDITLRADSALGASPSLKQSETCRKLAPGYFLSVRRELGQLVGQDLIVFVNGPPSIAHDVSEWIKREKLWQVTDELGKENASLEIERKGSKFNLLLILFNGSHQVDIDLLSELGTDLLRG